MNADITVLYRSPLVRILDLKCKEAPESVSAEFSDATDISFTRTGRFRCRFRKDTYDVDNGFVLLSEAGAEQTFSHGREVRDTCTVFQVSSKLLEEVQQPFRRSTEVFPKPILHTTPTLDYLHWEMFRMVQRQGWSVLGVEVLLLQMIEEIYMQLYGCFASQERFEPEERLRDLHLETIERAKKYMTEHFREEISLTDISRSIYVSEFHFSRLFKKFTACSPYRFLMEIRLKHAALLLRNTSLSVTEVCLTSGFNNFPHFITTFRRRYRMSPSRFRCSVPSKALLPPDLRWESFR